MPALGGHTLRGYPSWRFRDRNRVLMTGEYRWTAGNFVDMAIFLDAGKVAADWQDIELSGLKKGYGFGVRVHSNRQTFARMDFGTGGGEGWKVFLKLGPSF